HITRQDVLDLSAMLASEYRPVEFNIEGYPSAAFLDLVCAVKPTQCTLVPDPPDVLTSNAGWKLGSHTEWLRDVLERLADAKIRSSLFVEPDAATIER